MDNITGALFKIIDSGDEAKIIKILNSKKYYYEIRDNLEFIMQYILNNEKYNMFKIIIDNVDEDYILPKFDRYVLQRIKDLEAYKYSIDKYFYYINMETAIFSTFYNLSDDHLQYLLNKIIETKYDDCFIDNILLKRIVFDKRLTSETYRLFTETEIIDLYEEDYHYLDFIIKLANDEYDYDLYIKYTCDWFKKHGFGLDIVKRFKSNGIDYKKYM